jgi:hypothetical protein
MPAPCDIAYARGTSVRPAFVKPAFAGGCKIFPQPLPDGREPFFLGYQQAWSQDDGIMLIAEKSRQIGWTWTSAHGIARRHAVADYALDTWGTSRDDMQAMLAVQDCKKFADILHAGANDLGLQVLDARGSSGHVLAFANGTKYYSLSSNPDAQAGKRGGVIGTDLEGLGSARDTQQREGEPSCQCSAIHVSSMGEDVGGRSGGTAASQFVPTPARVTASATFLSVRSIGVGP